MNLKDFENVDKHLKDLTAHLNYNLVVDTEELIEESINIITNLRDELKRKDGLISDTIKDLDIVAKAELGVHWPDKGLDNNPYYTSWDDGEYLIVMGLHKLRKALQPQDRGEG